MNWVFNELDRLQRLINTWRGSSASTSSVNFSFQPPEKVNDHVYQVHKPAGRPSIEIVFFHGLQLEGSGKEAYLTTWLSAEGSELWPTWILKNFQDARILLVSYDASARRNDEQGIMDMYQTCENLVHSLTEETANVGGDGCPVIFVGHSIGCLVIKELCVKLHSAVNRVLPHNPKESVQNLLQNVKGLFYYACPHHGSELADNRADFPRGPLFEGIRTLNTEAQRRNEDFRELRGIYQWKTFGIGEGRPTTLGQFEDYVVSEASARCDVDDFYTCDYANHFNVCRPKCTTSSTFVHLAHFVGSVLQQDRDLRSPKICTPKGVYGLEGHVNDIIKKLSTGVRRLGITGMGGVGKTTLAEIVHQTISSSFEYTCFLRNVKKFMARNNTVQHLRKKIIKNLFYKGCKVKDTFSWETLRRKKVLILLDDVEREPEVQVMLESDGFSDGSTVVVTSRDKGFLRGEDFDCHVVEKLGKEDSKKLFCLNAFGKEEVDESVFKWRTEQFVKKCEGLPLALKIVGKYLHRQDTSMWDDTLKKLKDAESINGNGDDGLWSILRVCYTSLANKEKEMFLDVATCFHDQDLEKVKQAWSLCSWGSPFSGLKNLEDKGLVTIEENIIIEENSQPRRERIIRMHEVLRDLGRSIACPSTESVGAHTRLRYDLSYPLQTTRLFSEGKAQVKVLIISDCEDISIQSLHGLEELRVLWLEDVSLHGPLNLLPSNLAYLRISDSTLSIQPEGSLSQSDSKVSEERDKKRQRLWQISALKHLEINACELLEGSLDGLRQFHALEHLEISSLSNWTAVPESLGELRALKDLRVISCAQLGCIPYSLGRLLALKYLVIQDCQKVKAIPDSLWQLQALELLVVSCGCFKAPNALRRLRALRRFETTCCQNWEDVMDSFAELEALENIAIHSCIHHGYPVIDQLRLLESLTQRNLLQGSGQVDLPIFYEDSVLEIIGWNTEYLPNNFVGAGRVRRLLIKDCWNLKALPYEVGSLKVLEDLRIVNCSNLESLPDAIGELKALQSLSITSCKSLQSLPNTIRELQALTYLLISCGTKLQAPPNTLQHGNAFRLEITWCNFSRWKDFLETLGQLRTLQTLVVHRCRHSRPSAVLQLEFLESLTRRKLLQGPGRVDLPIFHLKHVTLNARIARIPSSFFHLGHAPSLTIRKASRIEFLPDTLGELEALKELDIENCYSLEALPDSLGELRALQKFTVRYCGQLKSLPEGVGKLEALKELDIHNCSCLEALPDSLGELRALQKFTVGYCGQLKSLSEGVGKLEALEELGIKNCYSLEGLPDSLGELQALQKFTVASCVQLMSLPEGVGKLEALKELDIENCDSLEALPDSLGELRALKQFTVASCGQLKSLPEGVGKLEALKELNIDGCYSLEALPDSLGELRALQKFTVRYCGQLKSLPEGVGNLQALKELRIEECNSLRALPDSLGELGALRKLKISSCDFLKSLPEGLGNLKVLKELYIQDCNSLEAPPDVLRKLHALKVFSVERCGTLKSFPGAIGETQL